MVGTRRSAEIEAGKEPTAKRIKTTPALAKGRVQIILEDENMSVEVEEVKLRRHFGYFDERLKAFEDGERKPLVIRDVYRDTFGLFQQLLTRSKVNVARLVKGRCHDAVWLKSRMPDYIAGQMNEETMCVLVQLVDLYQFAYSFQGPRLETAVMLCLQQLISQNNQIKVLPPIELLRYAYDKVDLNSPLCQYFVKCFARTCCAHSYNEDENDQLRGLPAKLLSSVITQLCTDRDAWENRKDKFKTEKQGRQWVWSTEDWCDYHKHDDEYSWKICKDVRESGRADSHRDEDGFPTLNGEEAGVVRFH